MLAIRLQRLGRKGLPHYRLIAQDSRFTPTSGRVAAYLGSYNPHTKALVIDKPAIEKHLADGAQPSPRIAMMLRAEGIKLPDWVKVAPAKTKTIKNVDKLRANRPKEEVVEEVAAAEEVEPVAEPVETKAEAVTQVKAVAEAKAETATE